MFLKYDEIPARWNKADLLTTEKVSWSRVRQKKNKEILLILDVLTWQIVSVSSYISFLFEFDSDNLKYVLCNLVFMNTKCENIFTIEKHKQKFEILKLFWCFLSFRLHNICLILFLVQHQFRRFLSNKCLIKFFFVTSRRQYIENEAKNLRCVRK